MSDTTEKKRLTEIAGGIERCGGCKISVIMDYLNLEAKIIDCRSIIQEKVNDQCR